MTNESGRTILIDDWSSTSLYVEVLFGTQLLSTATGFVVYHAGQPYLVTNWHVVSGRDLSGKPLSKTGGIPDTLAVWHNATQLGSWVRRTEPLVDLAGLPRWKEHPRGGTVIDVVLLPLTLDSEVALQPVSEASAHNDIEVFAASSVHVVGFPFGLSAMGLGPGFAIWKTGHLASDPDVDFNSTPSFLIDATTRGGMSGSPVIARVYPGSTRVRDGKLEFNNSIQPRTRFLGVYSSRPAGELPEIGLVWRPATIWEIANTA